LAVQPTLCAVVAAKLAADWSPEQIAGWLKVTYADDRAMQVSHETIYRSLFVQSRGVLKKALVQHLRRRRAVRRSQRATTHGQRRGQIVDALSIRERPATIEDRAVPGHWEGDLLAGAAQSHVATLVERQSRYLLLVRVRGKDTASVVGALSRHVRTLPRGLMASLTWDRGHELAAHKRFTLATHVQVYFCDPQSPWQRGSNENTNGLLRQYFPKGRDLATLSQAQLNRIARRLNERPRKTLGYQTPADRLAAIVASTG
jgi:IS30 family transposase